MSICARGIIFGIELIGFLIVCIIMLCKHYKMDKKFCGKRKAMMMRNDNIFSYSILYAVVFLLFLFSYPTLTFLSYDKILMVGNFVVMFSVIIISSYYFGTKKERFFAPLFFGTSIVCLIIFALMTTKVIRFGY